LLRLGRYVYAKGTPGVPGGGYTAKLSLALTPRLFRIERDYGEFGITLFGVRIHHLKSYGGWMAAIAVAAMLCFAGTASAQGRNVCGLRGHVQAVAVQHHAQAVVAKVVDYDHHAQALAVVNHAYPYYYQVGQGLRDEALTEKAADRVWAKIEERLAKIEAAGTSAPPASPDSPLGALQTLFDRSCVSCHDGSDEDRIDLTDATALSDGQLVGVYRQVYSGKMPKNAEPLKDEDVAVIAHALGSSP
jgi:mono/diheme cytochrome c family protein